GWRGWPACWTSSTCSRAEKLSRSPRLPLFVDWRGTGPGTPRAPARSGPASGRDDLAQAGHVGLHLGGFADGDALPSGHRGEAAADQNAALAEGGDHRLDVAAQLDHDEVAVGGDVGASVLLQLAQS